MSKIPQYAGASFSENDVINYLEELIDKGWQVGKLHHTYVITFNEEEEITLRYESFSKKWCIDASLTPDRSPFNSKEVLEFQSFKNAIVEAAMHFDKNIEMQPPSIRLKETTPVSNKKNIVLLARDNTVDCIFDPYFDDNAIITLITFMNLGMKLKETTKVLTTSKMKNHLSSQLVLDFEKEKGIKLNIRFCQSNKEHRRYLLMSTKESLIVGCSLNSLSKNEATHIEKSEEDVEFFEKQWKISLQRE